MPIYIGIETDQSNATVEFVNEGPPLAAFGNRNADVVQAINDYTNINSQIALYQFPQDRPKFYFMMSFSEYSRNDLLSVNAQLNTTETVILPLPHSLVDTHSVSYNEEPIGMLLGAAMQTGYAAKNQEAASQQIENVAGAGAALGVVGLAGAASSLAGGGLVGNPLAGLQAAFGFAPNQFFTVLLDGPKYKRHSLTWNLIPRNFAEADTIRRIIRLINNAMAPGLALAGGALFSFPRVVRCAFFPNHRYLYRFKPAVITDFQINYTPMSQPSFYHQSGLTGSGEDHPPESVEMSITLLEMEYWLRGDFLDGGAADSTTGDRTPSVNISQQITDSANDLQNTVKDLTRKYLSGSSGSPGVE